MTILPSFYAIIPATVRYDKDLEPCARLLYGEITALCSKEGYCWAANAYFSELYQVDTRTIQRWLEALKEKNHIRVDLYKNGLKTERKIWITEGIQNNFTTRQKCHGRHDKNVAVEDDKNAAQLLHPINTERPSLRSGPKAHAIFVKKRVRMKSEDHKNLVEEFGEKKIDEMMERLDEYADLNPKRFDRYANHATVIRKWLRDEPLSSKPSEDLSSFISSIKEKNINLFRKGEIEMLQDAICFKHGTYYLELAFNDKNFKEKLTRQLSKMGAKL